MVIKSTGNSEVPPKKIVQNTNTHISIHTHTHPQRERNASRFRKIYFMLKQLIRPNAKQHIPASFYVRLMNLKTQHVNSDWKEEGAIAPPNDDQYIGVRCEATTHTHTHTIPG